MQIGDNLFYSRSRQSYLKIALYIVLQHLVSHFICHCSFLSGNAILSMKYATSLAALLVKLSDSNDNV